MFRNLVRLALLFIVCRAAPLAAEPVKTEHVEADLVSEVESIRASEPFWLAVHLRMEEHWHTYWRYAGDAGLPTTVEWELPKGFSAGPIQWPYPERIVVSDLVNFGYEGEVLLLTQITPPDDLTPGNNVSFTAQVEWLVCKEACIPGNATVTLALPVKTTPPQPDPHWVEEFADARSSRPLPTDDWTLRAALDEDRVTLQVTPPAWASPSVGSAVFYPQAFGLVDIEQPQRWQSRNGVYTLTMARDKTADETPDRLEGILVTEDGWRGPGSEKALSVSAEFGTTALPAASATDGLWLHLLGAFLGGIILNLMPCVFPILSIKILGFVNQAGEDHAKVWQHGLVFSLGVLLSFWVLAGLLVALRAAGEQIGWGFQLQSPTVVTLLAALMFLFGLNLFGVFEVGGSLTGVGASAAGRSTFAGSFFSGLLATLIATPCTAPFMGAALGFALTRPPSVAFLIFTCLALGMAAPYMLLSSSPALLRILPKPGAWMETLKQFFGFLLMATVIWLAWVLSFQLGANGVIALAAGLLVMAVGCWVLGRWAQLSRPPGIRHTARVVGLLIIIAGLNGTIREVRRMGPIASAAPAATGELAWETFAPGRVDEIRATGHPVFVDFTAAWCLTCQVNERVVLASKEIQQRFTELGIVPMRADWTQKDPVITEALASFGRSGVPFYVIYPAQDGAEPITLSEILTPSIVLDGLSRLNP